MQADCSVVDVVDAVSRASSVVCYQGCLGQSAVVRAPVPAIASPTAVTLRGAAPSDISPHCIGTNVDPRSARGSSQIGSQEAR